MVFQNYTISGNQDAENIYDEWARFAAPFNLDVVYYARALFTDQDMDLLGKALPKEAQRDIGVIDPNNTYDRRAAEASERKRMRREQVVGGTPVTASSSSSGRRTTPDSAPRPVPTLLRFWMRTWRKQTT